MGRICYFASKCDKQDAFYVVDEIRKKVEATPYYNGEDEIGVMFSAGVVNTQTCSQCPRIDDFIAMAEKALYRARMRAGIGLLCLMAKNELYCNNTTPKSQDIGVVLC